MHRHNHHHKVWLVAVTTSAMIAALPAGGWRAHAQSLNDSPSHATDSMSELDAASSRESVNIDAPDGPAVSADSTTANRIDDATAPPSDNSDIGPPPPAGAAVSDEASVSGTRDDAVLEIPQVVNLPNGNSADRPADGAAASAEGNDETAQSNQGGDNGAADDDLGPTADHVGTVEDYENQAGAVPLGPIFFAPGVAIVRLPRLPLLSPLPGAPIGVPMATSPIILPPTSSGPFPSTSPMLMAPRIGTLGSFPRAGWMGPRGGFVGSRGGLMGFHR